MPHKLQTSEGELVDSNPYRAYQNHRYVCLIISSSEGLSRLFSSVVSHSFSVGIVLLLCRLRLHS